ncbi:hypothetical protein [Pseudomonas shirazensis]|uniref:hypothetical protein n=1 Tax=Pseudomonas shirazensis TaxID=2745494 RepID=UPI003D26F650
MNTSILPVRLGSLSPMQSRRIAFTENPRNLGFAGIRARAMGPTGKLWKPGRMLTVSFFSKGPEKLKAAIYELGRSWIDQTGANLQMQRAEDNDSSAEIRIQCAPEAYCNGTHLGTDILDTGSVNLLLCLEPGHELFEFSVLHEFGHVFGLDHEHQHPEADIPWNARAAGYYASELGGASEEELQEQVFRKRSSADLINTGYDRSSVMHYPVSQYVTSGDWTVGINSSLSDKDIEFMRLAYPHE